MNKQKSRLIIGACLILLGCIIFAGVMTVLKWDFSKLQTVKFETNNYEINEEIRNVTVKTNTADVGLVPCDGGKISVVCFEQKNLKHSVKVDGGTLSIEVADTRKWYEYIGISFSSPKITVYIPAGEYGKLSVNTSTGKAEVSKDFKFETIDIKVTTGGVKNFASATGDINITASTGDITVENVSAHNLKLSVTTGKITASALNCSDKAEIKVSTGKTILSNLRCEDFVSNGSTGNITLSDVIAENKFSVNRSTGDVKLEKCDASELFIKTDTGNVKGSLLSDKVFIVKTDTGKAEVPETVEGGRCEIETDTGNVKIEILK